MKILGYDYTMEIGSDENMRGNLGLHILNSQKIWIASNLCPQQNRSTILHEIIEALNYHLELGLEHNVIMSLESGLYQVLTDNGVDLAPLELK